MYHLVDSLAYLRRTDCVCKAITKIAARCRWVDSLAFFVSLGMDVRAKNIRQYSLCTNAFTPVLSRLPFETYIWMTRRTEWTAMVPNLNLSETLVLCIKNRIQNREFWHQTAFDNSCSRSQFFEIFDPHLPFVYIRPHPRYRTTKIHVYNAEGHLILIDKCNRYENLPFKSVVHDDSSAMIRTRWFVSNDSSAIIYHQWFISDDLSAMIHQRRFVSNDSP